jgi:hypothetical protein
MMDFDSVTRDWKWCGRYALDSIIEAGERLARTDTHRATLDDMRSRDSAAIGASPERCSRHLSPGAVFRASFLRMLQV